MRSGRSLSAGRFHGRGAVKRAPWTWGQPGWEVSSLRSAGRQDTMSGAPTTKWLGAFPCLIGTALLVIDGLLANGYAVVKVSI
jgi:hypothetical protein